MCSQVLRLEKCINAYILLTTRKEKCYKHNLTTHTQLITRHFACVIVDLVCISQNTFNSFPYQTI